MLNRNIRVKIEDVSDALDSLIPNNTYKQITPYRPETLIVYAANLSKDHLCKFWALLDHTSQYLQLNKIGAIVIETESSHTWLSKKTLGVIEIEIAENQAYTTINGLESELCGGSPDSPGTRCISARRNAGWYWLLGQACSQAVDIFKYLTPPLIEPLMRAYYWPIGPAMRPCIYLMQKGHSSTC